jgi:signal transduction histidine kinase
MTDSTMPPDDPASPYLDLISLAVHELRTPTSVVAGYLRMLLREQDQPLSERQLKMLTEAERSCERLAMLVSELSEIQKLDASRIDTGPLPTFDLFPLVADVAKSVQEAHDRGVVLEVRGQAEGAAVRGDRSRIQRAFSAIFRAILREMPADAKVVAERRVDTTGVAASAIVVVASEQDVEAAYVADPAPLDELRGGVGLTLPFARRVFERCGGRVWSPSGDRRRGAAIVSLPLAELKP